MIGSWKQLSDTYKILIAMLFLIVFIQLSTLFYIWKFETKVLLERERENLKYQLNLDAKLLVKHFESLKKELDFLATLEVMDDIVVDDIDKRISILLEKKSKDLSEGIILLAKKHQKNVASSKIDYKAEEFLTFNSVVHASFDKKKKIGELELLYPLKSLINISSENPRQHLWLTPPTHKTGFISPNVDDSIVVSTELIGILKKWKLNLSYEKKYALSIIEEIEMILFLGSLFSLFSLLLVSWILSKKQIAILHHTQEVLEMKKTFLSTMSHELRTPLGSILNLTQHLMVSPKISDSDVDMLRGIENSSEHLLSMINNLLQLSKLDSNSMSVKKESVDILKVFEEVIDIVEPLIEEKGLTLKQDFPKGTCTIITDVHHLKQIIMNLLSNAIKFTESGSITLSFQEKNEQFVFTVIDTGVGIAKDMQASLFSEFYQAHMGKRDVKHSTGLGLALSQKVAELIEGKIEIESEGLGKGVKATFSFTSL